MRPLQSLVKNIYHSLVALFLRASPSFKAFLIDYWPWELKMAFFLRRLNLYSKRHPPGVIDRIDAKYCKQTFFLSAQEILLLWNRPWQCSNSEWIFFFRDVPVETWLKTFSLKALELCTLILTCKLQKSKLIILILKTFG